MLVQLQTTCLNLSLATFSVIYYVGLGGRRLGLCKMNAIYLLFRVPETKGANVTLLLILSLRHPSVSAYLYSITGVYLGSRKR